MRIHIIGINYWPEVTGIAVFSTGRAEHLASAGHEVTMCTAVPYYPQWRVPAEYRRAEVQRARRAPASPSCGCPLYVPSAVNADSARPARGVVHRVGVPAQPVLPAPRPPVRRVAAARPADRGGDPRLALAGAVRLPRRRPAARHRARSRDGAAGPCRAAALRGRAAGVSTRRDRLDADRRDARANHRERHTRGKGRPVRRLGRPATVRARPRASPIRSVRSWGSATPSSCSTPATWA